MPEFNVSRRKVLAGLGTIGIASAGAGLGTTAFFSDEESLEGSLEAGKIDLKLDYRSTYVPWDRQTPFDSIGTIPGTDMDDDGTDDRYVLDETPNVTYSEDEAADRDDVEAGDLLTEDDWGVLTNNIGCEGEDAEYDLVDGDAGVVVDLVDIKPKDEGEFTVSMHVCDNRAYLWMQTEKTLDSDNGVVEPEAQAGVGAWDEAEAVDGSTDGDLDDFMYVQAWYDTNCNNIRDGGEDVDVAILFDTSGSMNETTPGAGLNDAPEKLEAVKDAVVDLSTFLTTDSRVTVYSFDSDFEREYDLASPDPSAIESAIASATADGGTVYSDVIEAAANYLNTDSAARPDARKIMVFLSDGGPKNELDDTNTGTNPSPTDGTTDEDRVAALAAVNDVTSGADPLIDDLYTIAYETADDSNASQLLEDMATEEAFAFSAGEGGVELSFREIGRSIRGDVLLYQGSLAGFLALGANGVSLDPGQDEDYVVSQQGSADACVDPGVTCIALDWYLPCFYEQGEDGRGFSQLPSSRPGVADQDGDGEVTLADELVQLRGHSVADLEAFDAINVVQTDSVEWTMRFAAIQCRHNMANANPYASASETVTFDSDDAPAFEQAALDTTTSESRLGSGSWMVAGDGDGDGSDDKLFLWLDPKNDPRLSALGSFTVDDIAELSYYSKKPASDTSPVDFYVTLYTEPDGVDDAASWYGRRLTFEPYLSRSLNAPSGQWNNWSTVEDGENVLTFYDSVPLPSAIQYGFYGQPTLAEAQAGAVDWSALVPSSYQSSTSSTAYDYGAEEIKSIVLATGTGWADDFVGYFDGFRIQLTDGTDLTIDFEA